jgi:putative copper export protein
MHAFRDFFSTDYGLMSAGVIVFMLGMGVFYVRYFLKHMHEDEARARAASK